MSTPLHPQTEPADLGEHNGFPVYAMPMFGLVAVSDPVATVRWFTEVLDFEVMYEGPRVGNVVQLSHLRRARYQDILITPARGPVSTGRAVTLTFQVGEADDVDRLAERATVAGGDLEGPIDTPWGTRDFSIVDPDGIRFTLTGRGRQPVAVPEPLGDFTEATS